MPLSNVFISSRMEELAFERRSAFDALYLGGLTPFAFETEPTGETEKDMIDNLVDSSDLFVGIYYLTIGARQPQLANLEPIAYELYRFLFRCWDPDVRRLTEEEKHREAKAKLDALLGDEDSLRELRSQIRLGLLNQLLSARVRLVRMTHRYDVAVSRRLTEFLLPFHQGFARLDDDGFPFLHSFEATRETVSGPVVEGAKNCERFLTARFQLFSLIDSLIQDAKDKGFEIRDQAWEGPRYRWRVCGRDQRGALYVVLDTIFRERFNIEMVCSGQPTEPDAEPGRLVIDVVARPFLPSGDSLAPVDSSYETITENLQDILAGDFTVEGERLPAWPKHRKSDWEKRERPDRYYYVLETADVPGQVLALAQRILFYEANIDLLFFDNRSDSLFRPAGRKGSVATILFAVSPNPPSSPLFQRPMTRARFLTEIRQGLGVLAVQELGGPEKFYERLEESNRQIILD